MYALWLCPPEADNEAMNSRNRKPHIYSSIGPKSINFSKSHESRLGVSGPLRVTRTLGLPSSSNYYPSHSNEIRFYHSYQPYYEFANFYPREVTINGKSWPSTEHFFQAQKFVGTPIEEKIRKSHNARQAFNIARKAEHMVWQRPDWHDPKVKEKIMRLGLLEKFTQHKDLRKKLLSTEGKELIEHTTDDSYWGDGGSPGVGQNRLGKLLMEVRQEILSNTRRSAGKSVRSTSLDDNFTRQKNGKDTPVTDTSSKSNPNGRERERTSRRTSRESDRKRSASLSRLSERKPAVNLRYLDDTSVEKTYRNAARPTCKLPGCSNPCYVEGTRVHDFCGRTHAYTYMQNQNIQSSGTIKQSSPQPYHLGTEKSRRGDHITSEQARKQRNDAWHGHTSTIKDSSRSYQNGSLTMQYKTKHATSSQKPLNPSVICNFPDCDSPRYSGDFRMYNFCKKHVRYADVYRSTGGPAPHQGNFSGIKYTQKKEPLSIEHSRSGTPSKRDTRPSSRNDSSQMSGLLQHH